MPYIYNHFAWDHCEEDFEGAINDMYAKYLKGEITSTSTTGKSPNTPPVSGQAKGGAGGGAGGGGKTQSPPTLGNVPGASKTLRWR
jgi:hypothetical protein